MKPNLSLPLSNFPKISKKIIPALKHLGIRTMRDLLFYFPARYDNFSNLKKIEELSAGEMATIQGQIEDIKTIRLRGRRMTITEAKVGDETGVVKSVWYNQPFLERNLKIGDIVNLSGKITYGKYGLFLQSPAYEKMTFKKGSGEINRSVHTGGLVAVYPETRGLTSRWLRFLIKTYLPLAEELVDSLPENLRKKYDFPEIRESLRHIHFPADISQTEKARKRFNFEELLILQLFALKERTRLKQHPAPVIETDLELIKKFVSSLPFRLTDAQRRSIWEISKDLARPRPMNRLLEGDVGSGKTLVASVAALLAASQGLQTAFMAPTEILAAQHFKTLSDNLSPFGIKTGLLTGSRKNISPDTKIFVGTHALIQKKVKFENLALVVVDEQHRFGVEQRSALIKKQKESDKKNPVPHFLSLSATPIPRTLALAIYGDLDLSVLDEMPRARKPVFTKLVKKNERRETYDFAGEEIKKGRQVFVVCPRIEISKNDTKEKIENFSQQKLKMMEVKAVTEEYKKLSEIIFPDSRVAMLHGKIKPKEKEKIMNRFKNHETDILVSTSVIEVGVDVPNATIMMIEGAERFGLAQLHQFRGRVGRGAEQSYCFLFTTEDGTETARLKALTNSQNGFELAEKDLKIRGPGEVFGMRQWGQSGAVTLAINNPELVRMARQEAAELARQDPTLASFPGLSLRLRQMQETAHLE